MRERAVRWVRRQPALAAFIALFVLSLLAGTSVSIGFALIAREQAKKANTALDTANKAKELTESTLSTSLVRPLGIQEDKITTPEIAATWDLATLTATKSALRLLFIKQALGHADTARQLRNRADLAVHAAVGLEPSRRRAVKGLLTNRLQAQNGDFETRVACVLAGTNLDDWDPAFAALAVQEAVGAAGQTNDTLLLDELARSITALAPQTAPADAAALAAAAARQWAKPKTSMR